MMAQRIACLVYNNLDLLGGASTDENGMFSIKIGKNFTHLKISFIEKLYLNF